MTNQHDDAVRRILAAGGGTPSRPSAPGTQDLLKTAASHPLFGGIAPQELQAKLAAEYLDILNEEAMVKVAEEAIQEAASDLSTLLVKHARANGTLSGIVKQASQGDSLREQALTQLVNEIR